MKLWLDDVRPAPEGWELVRTAAAAIRRLETGGVKEVSLDHDLGSDFGPPVTTGYEVASWIERAAAEGRLGPITVRCHSANPVGRERIEAALASARRF